MADASPENLRRSVDTINDHLRGFKKLDLFECARVDPNVRIEETIETLSLFVKEGKFDYIGLSECRADTLRRANAVRLLLCASITCGSHVCAGNCRCTPLLRWRSKSARGPTRKKRKKASRSSLPATPSLECKQTDLSPALFV